MSIDSMLILANRLNLIVAELTVRKVLVQNGCEVDKCATKKTGAYQNVPNSSNNRGR